LERVDFGFSGFGWERLLAVGCWLLATGCWLLAASCWPQAAFSSHSRDFAWFALKILAFRQEQAGFGFKVSGCLPLTPSHTHPSHTHFSLLTHSLLTHSPLTSGNCPPPTGFPALSTAYRTLPTAYWFPRA